MTANISKIDKGLGVTKGAGEYEENDYFGYVFEDTTTFNLKVLAWALTQFVGNPLMLGLIAYKRHGSLNYQTLVDKVCTMY